MDKNFAKEGFEKATDELKENQIAEVKKVVLKTLEKIAGKTKERDKLSDEIRLLKMDIDDLKAGKIEHIVERQEKDPKAKEVAVVIIIKEKEIKEISPWYWPYKIIWQPAPVYGSGLTSKLTFCDSANTLTTNASGNFASYSATDDCCITNSAAKDGVVGSYTIENKVVHLR